MEDEDFPTAEYDTNECFVPDDKERNSLITMNKQFSSFTLVNSNRKPKKLNSEKLEDYTVDRSPQLTCKKD